jgi:hypothetical protein
MQDANETTPQKDEPIQEAPAAEATPTPAPEAVATEAPPSPEATASEQKDEPA